MGDAPSLSVTHHMNTMEEQRGFTSRLNSPLLRPVGMVVGLIIVLCVLYVVFYVVKQQRVNASVDAETYQIVTLDSGRSYFGSLNDLEKEYVLLENAFFLKANSPDVDAEGNVVEPSTDEEELPFSLQRVGNQVHQGNDNLYIRADHIVSWQNLETDSPVVTAIDEYLASKEDLSNNDNGN